MTHLLYLALGLVLGGAIGWLMGARRQPAVLADHRVEDELREQLEHRDVELGQLRSQLTETGNARAAAEAKQAAEIAFLNERLASERAQIQVVQEKFQKEFEAVANKLLVENSSRFGRQSAESLDRLLGPLKENLNEFKTRLETAHRDASAQSALLKDQINRIGTEAANLSKALKGDVKVLGNWGENMLDQILEKSGLQIGIHYRRQGSAKDVDGDQRFLDVIVELPDNRHLVVDSKVSLKHYEEHVNSSDELIRRTHLLKHIDCIRDHYRGLGAKRYQDLHGINAPDFVLMYIPIEAAFFVAVAEQPGLFAEALEKNVVLITNSTLLATLRTVASVWRLADQQKNAIEIADRGGKLYDKFVGFIGDLVNIGDGLKKCHALWEEATRKLHTGSGNLVRQAEQLKNLGAKAAKSMPAQVADQSEDEGTPPPAASL